MSEDVAVAGNTEQEGKYVRKPFTMNAVIERPAPANSIPNATAADWAARGEATENGDEVPINEEEPCSFHIQLDSAFASITPIECPAQPENNPSRSIIHRPHAGEMITIIYDPIVVDCFVADLRCACGNYAVDLSNLSNLSILSRLLGSAGHGLQGHRRVRRVRRVVLLFVGMLPVFSPQARGLSGPNTTH
jgi:hypothetical protein